MRKGNRIRRALTALLAASMLLTSSSMTTFAESGTEGQNEETEIKEEAPVSSEEEAGETAAETTEDLKDSVSPEESESSEEQKVPEESTESGETEFSLEGYVRLTDLQGQKTVLKEVKIRFYDADSYDPDSEENSAVAETGSEEDGFLKAEGLTTGNYRIEYISMDGEFCPEDYKASVLPEEAGYEVIMAEDEKAAEEAAGGPVKERDYFAVIPSLELESGQELDLELEEKQGVGIETIEETEEQGNNEENLTGEIPKENSQEPVKGQTEEQAQENSQAETEMPGENNSGLTGSLTVAQLAQTDNSMAGATVEQLNVNGFYSRLKRMASGSEWTFDTYYVNEDDKYDVEKSEDFNLKYQMEFYTSRDITAGSVEIRIQETLLYDREGNPVTPTEIAVPQASPEEEPIYSRNTPFNYYKDGTTLVFYNYREIQAGTSAAWQVLYKQLDVMEIKDETRWELTPTIFIRTEQTETRRDLEPLTGKVNTYAEITSLAKKAYVEPGKSYTPGLYTQSQVERYITGELPAEYAGENFDNYRYVVWKVDLKGEATQPWNLEIREVPSIIGGTAGKVVGYRNYLGLNADLKVSDDYTEIINGSKKEALKGYLYVVTAYPANQVQAGTVLENQFDVRLTPADGEDPVQEKSSSATWNWANYEWTYEGDEIQIGKDGGSSAELDTHFGWLELYKYASDRQEDAGSFSYSSAVSVRGYKLTHVTEPTEGQTLGEYIEGSSYRTTLVDDFMYAYPGETGTGGAQMLGSEDYYFTDVTVRQADTGYDVWENSTSAAEKVNDVAQDMKIYAMFADSETEEWELVATVPWNNAGVMFYSFSEDQLSRQPWRVKVEHETINYETYCAIDVEVRIRHGSPAMAAMADSDYVRLEDLCGTIVEELEDGQFKRYCYEAPTEAPNYQEPGLREASEQLYGVLPARDNAYKTLTGLIPHAESHKTVKGSNDPDNSRMLLNYCLTASDGYYIYDHETAEALERGGVPSPGRNNVVFYDLLPYGVHFDPSVEVTAGRIRDVNDLSYQTQPRSWDQSQVTVTVDPEKDIIEDYRGSGRTMVIFHIQYEGADSAVYSEGRWTYDSDGTQVYRDGMWAEGWGVSFQAYYDWKDLDVVHENANISAFMPEDKEGDPLWREPLFGTEDEVAFDDGTIVPQDLAGDYEPFKDGDLNEDDVTDIRNVLYASAMDQEDIAIAGMQGITKLVRADADRFGSYQNSAVVGPGKRYTYDITVSAGGQALTDIVIFDQLENADPENGGLYGTFQSVDTTGLEEMGAEPVVYYNEDRNAKLPAEGQEPSEILTEAYGWYPAGEFLTTHTASKVRAVAVDLSQAAGGGAFALEDMRAASFQIRMQAPDSIPDTETDICNSPVYYAKNEMLDMTVLSEGNSVKVRLGREETLEVVKEFAGETPEAVQDTSFQFYLYEEEDGQRTAFANKEYQLWKLTDGAWIQQTDRMYATDGSGILTLKAGEKAVFTELPDAGRIQIEEEENPFWKTEITDNETVDDSGTAAVRTVTAANTYRPVLYAQKKTQAVPKGVDISGEEFTFQLRVKGEDGTYTPVSNAEFWYVNSARTDGGIPTKVTSLGTAGEGYTDEEGRFTIRPGEIIALFPGDVGVEYQLKEVSGANGESDNWLCNSDTVEGTVPLQGISTSITNIYRWKDLLLTKNLTHQDPSDCTQEFTFRIKKVEGDSETPVSGKEWVLLNSDGTESTAPGDSGTLNENGEFTCDCAGRTVRIRGLEGGETYIITETNSGELYRAANTTQEAEMPLYSSSRSVEFINDYLMRSLSVTKFVNYDRADQAEVEKVEAKEFTMTASVEGEPLGNHTYTLTEGGSVIGEYQTGADGTFTLKDGQTAELAEAGMLGESFEVEETEDSDYKQIYPTEKQPHTGTLGSEGSEVTFINGTPGGLAITKEYEGADEAARTYIEQMKGGSLDLGTGEWTDTSSRIEAAVSLTLEATDSTGDTYIWPRSDTQVTVIDTLRGETTEETWSAGSSFELMPWKIVLITDSALEGVVSYRLSESEEDQHRIIVPTIQMLAPDQDPQSRGIIVLPDMSWKAVSQKEPAGDRPISGTLEEQPIAKIINEISTVTIASEIYKKMTLGSDEVPEGAKLVWRVEQYDGMTWNPSEGVDYVTSAEGIPTCDRILTTGSDGKITLTKAANGYPSVRFTEADVSINLYEGAKAGDYRVVEVPEESDESWGLLAGYGFGGNTVDSDHRDPDKAEESGDISSGRRIDSGSDDPGGDGAGLEISTGQNLYKKNGNAFVNSNRTTPVEIEKKMENPSDTDFTMILEQVLSIKDQSHSEGSISRDSAESPSDEIVARLNPGGGSQLVSSADDILATRPGAGISYTVYDTATDAEIRTDVTGARGEIILKAGQYARLYLPDQTVWTVREELKADHVLKNLSGTPENRVTKLGDNLMLIQPTAEVIPAELDVRMEDNRVTAGEVLDKDNFIVNVIYSDGRRIQLTSEEFTLDPETIPSWLAGSSGEVTVYWTEGGLEGTTTFTVVDEIDITQEMVNTGVTDAKTGQEVVLNSGDVTIPEYIIWEGGEYRVTGVANSAFQESEITGIHFPDSIERIGNMAFDSCTHLKGDLEVPAATIGEYAFAGCDSLTGEIKISGGSIGDYAFQSCTQFTRLKLMEGVTSIGDYAFYNCPLISGDLNIPEGVLSIGECAFAENYLGGEYPTGRLSLPSTLKIIENYAFMGCEGLYGKLIIPKEVANIGDSAFEGTNFTSISVDNTPDAITGAPWGWEGGEVIWLRQ
ncbi:leucine-rich repeat domain-containing protein [Clostridium sp. Marseille-P3244]|uniref:leucine-rich repeat domain-containing protein n=1 Tax=Clostridium sp. Marseille-P3244 TaxID=1871020 RepID=UPI0009310220|nr:leucine-rich repeat domain-containing protein [Clostridium sp. Marseille-P3244]